MTAAQLQRIRRWWSAYVRKFDGGDADIRRNVRLKKFHTLRVCREAAMLSRALNLPPVDARLAEALVLLHDVGRFEQYLRYRTFADRLSEDHALLGLRIISREGVLSAVAPPERTILRAAITYHNRARVPPVRNARVVLFSKLLRDADKLDIWRVVIQYHNTPAERKNHAVVVGLPDAGGITPAVMADLRARRIVSRENMRSQDDFKVLQLGWVFDVNFEPTLRAVVRRKYLERLWAALPECAEKAEVLEIVREYAAAGRAVTSATPSSG